MKKVLIKFLAVAAVVMSMSSCGYNSMVEKQETVTSSWAQVENEQQRKLDLIDNLVEVVKQTGKFETEAYTSIVQARNEATQARTDAANVQIDSAKLTQADIDRYQQAQYKASTSANNLIKVVVEAYPELKATQAYITLMDELTGTENRIKVARSRYNEAVQDYNTYIKKFPNNMTAGWFDFEQKGYFKADPEASKPYKIKF